MNKLVGVITMVMLLIGIYLVLRNGKESVNIINSMASNSVAGIKALQGR